MKNLIVLVGATGVGKSDLSISLAQWLDAPIISSDSRQIYRQMRIGTAVPSEEQLNAAKHYFIQTQDATTLYTAGDYSRDVMELLPKLFAEHNNVLLVGGSGLYIDAVCNGIDDIPAADITLRETLNRRVADGELPIMLEELKALDPVYYDAVDKGNAKRVTRALEVIISTGRPFSSFRSGEVKKRDFNILKIGVFRPREELYERINRRVDLMMEEGLLEEATSLYPLRTYNALQTVGYREFFDYIDGVTTLEEAIDLLKRNTRRYAKRQTTWFKRDKNTMWFHPDEEGMIKDSISKRIEENQFISSLCENKSDADLFEIMENIQNKYGYISVHSIHKLASFLGVDTNRINNIVEYNDNFSAQTARYPICICLGKLCKKQGGERLIRFVEGRLGVEMGEMSADGRFSLSKRNCIGNCATAPTLWIGEKKYDNVNEEKLNDILNGLP